MATPAPAPAPAPAAMPPNPNASLPPWPLPQTITSEYIPLPAARLTMHILSSSPPTPTPTTAPLILLLHGFPELSFSWRHVLPALAAAGYRAVAPDLRGYGRTTSWDPDPAHLRHCAPTNVARDLVALLGALGHDHAALVVGHDFGAVAAGALAGIRGDLVGGLVTMSHPLPGWGRVTDLPGFGNREKERVLEELGRLEPARKHYKWYNATEGAVGEWDAPGQGMPAFLRGYFHLKSADWEKNKPEPLAGWSAAELARLPEYYVMRKELSMPETVARNMAVEDARATERWLGEAELAVYAAEWARTGFRGGLNWYRANVDAGSPVANDMALFAGRRVEVPTLFLSGAKDWGNYQDPGALEGMKAFCTRFEGVEWIEGAGHWPAQEQPEKVVEGILGFLKRCGR